MKSVPQLFNSSTVKAAINDAENDGLEHMAVFQLNFIDKIS